MNIFKFSSLLLFLFLIKNVLTAISEKHDDHELSETDTEFWNTNAQEVLKERIEISLKKTVFIFISFFSFLN